MKIEIEESQYQKALLCIRLNVKITTVQFTNKILIPI